MLGILDFVFLIHLTTKINKMVYSNKRGQGPVGDDDRAIKNQIKLDSKNLEREILLKDFGGKKELEESEKEEEAKRRTRFRY